MWRLRVAGDIGEDEDEVECPSGRIGYTSIPSMRGFIRAKKPVHSHHEEHLFLAHCTPRRTSGIHTHQSHTPWREGMSRFPVLGHASSRITPLNCFHSHQCISGRDKARHTRLKLWKRKTSQTTSSDCSKRLRPFSRAQTRRLRITGSCGSWRELYGR
jgi:hypothetical protein